MKKLMVVLGILVALLVLIGGAAIVMLYRQNHAAPPAATQPATAVPLTFQDRVALVTAACGEPPTIRNETTTRDLTCPVCPKGSDFSGGKGMPGSNDGWIADGFLPGHFTTADADEALLHETGCESHARNYGGDFILHRIKGQWSTIRYASGGTADDKCQKLTWQEGRDALVCQSSDMHQGTASDAVQFLLFDAAAPANEDWKNTLFLETTDDSSNCGFTTAQHTMQIGKIGTVQLLPPDANTGKQDVTLMTTLARFPAPPEGKEGCPATTPKIYKVHFKNMGDHFEAAEGYTELTTLAKDDCCELTFTGKVRPGKY